MSTFVLLGTVGGAAGSYTFSNIPQTYKDLVIIGAANQSFNANTASASIRVNGLTSGYSWVGHLYQSNNQFNFWGGYNNDIIGFYTGATSNVRFLSPVEMRFFDYANSSYKKSCMIRSGAGASALIFSETLTNSLTGFMNTTAAITSIEIRTNHPPSVNWSTETKFSLYGLASS